MNVTDHDDGIFYLFNMGEDYKAYMKLGAHKLKVNGKMGYSFAVWAPNARGVYLLGDFNNWETLNSMVKLPSSGVWRTFIEGLGDNEKYKYLIITEDGKKLFKADPYAFFSEKRPDTASITYDLDYKWQDEGYNKGYEHFNSPMNIYEMHMGSWKRHKDNSFMGYRELAKDLTDYLIEMGYTHVEFLPVMEHPFDGSWGYQISGYYAPTSRYGAPNDFKYLIDYLHQNGIKVILDWVPGHFCKDAHGIANFVGDKLYEKEEHMEWGTYKFDYEKNEVISFLISNIVFWIEEYHIDGFRVDGISSMIYLNYGNSSRNHKRAAGEEDPAAIAFLKRMNETVSINYPKVFMIAEESTAWPLVTYPPGEGGLGFHYKWDMGWMHDTLEYFELNENDKSKHHRKLTFSTMYQNSENFILPLSHDEVVHGKLSIIGRIDGEYEDKFANLRMLYLYQMSHMGGKLNFMGNEIAQFIEWRYYEEIQWFLLNFPSHNDFNNYIKRLNHLYLNEKAFWEYSYEEKGFEWIDADNENQSVFSYIRRGKNSTLVFVFNLKSIEYEEYIIGVPKGKGYREIFNSNSITENMGIIKTENKKYHNQRDSIKIKLPKLTGVVFKKVN